MGFHRGPNIVRDGLVLALDAASPRSYPGSGTTWYDLSGNGNNGTLTGGVSLSSLDSGCMDFDGTDDRIIVDDNDILDVDQFTLSFYAYPEVSAVKEMVVRHSSATGGIGAFEVYQNSLNITVRHNGSHIQTTPSTVFTLNQWHSICLTYDKQNIKLYVNSTEQFSVSRTVSTNSYTAPLVIGGYYNGTYSFNGKLNLVKLYNRGLTSNEVAQNYNATKSRFGL